MSDLEPIELNPLAKADSAPKRNCGVQWALPVDARLDALVESAHSAGEKTTRRELLSAIVCAVQDDAEELGRILRSYRLKTVAEVVGQQPGSDNVIAIQRHRPGPRHNAG